MTPIVTNIIVAEALPDANAFVSGHTLLVAGILLLFALAFGANFLTRRLLLVAIGKAAARTRTIFDDQLIEQGVFSRLSHLAPAIILHLGWGYVLGDYPRVLHHVHLLTYSYILIAGALAISAFLATVSMFWQRRQGYEHVPVRGFMQVIQIILFAAVSIACLSLLMNRSPAILLSGLGAMTAVLMLVFKDAILGLVAGIQLSANRMLRIGDWLEMPGYGADGDVIDITLTTVKVQNWDKTITTIPTYALISDSFKNWRGMTESGGRRIKRSLFIDMTSIQFCSPEMIASWRKISVLADYIETKLKDIREHNQRLGIDESVPANGRRITNIGTFRAYVVAYLRTHPMINTDMTFLVRQLEPTDHGLPLQVYVFCKDKVWANYESIQSDIFDHLLAIIPQFGLRLYQNPTGHDFKGMLKRED